MHQLVLRRSVARTCCRAERVCLANGMGKVMAGMRG